MPSVDGLYEVGEKKIDAIFVSHSHGDHIGLFPYVNKKIPIFIGEKACGIYNMTGRFTGSNTFIEAFAFFQHCKPIFIGDFKVIPYLVDHSGYDAYAFVIFANGKSVVYTGDIRGHGKKGKLTEYFLNSLPKEPDVLLMEGTMLGRMVEKIQTEEEIKKEATHLMAEISKPVLVLQSATNIDRLVVMYHAAKNSNRLLCNIFAPSFQILEKKDNVNLCIYFATIGSKSNGWDPDSFFGHSRSKNSVNTKKTCPYCKQRPATVERLHT
jgi:ribonuclease J